MYRLTASQARAGILASQFTLETYVAGLLARIEERDPAVHAWAYLDRQRALREARRLDGAPRGPLFGVVVGVDDLINTNDMPTRHHSPLYEKDGLQRDAASVAILRSAGALILGKLHTTELGIAMDTSPVVHPMDPKRSPGSSASGPGAAVGDMQVPLALSVQSGGSTIKPASFNGIFGFKPTFGIISTEGQQRFHHSYESMGLMGRSVEDLQLVFRELDWRRNIVDSPPSSLADCTFAMIKTPDWDQAGPSTVDAMARSVDLLRQAGAQVEKLELPTSFNQEGSKWRSILSNVEMTTTLYSHYRTAKEKLDPDVREKFFEKAEPPSRQAYFAALDGIGALRQEMDAIANRYTALITPSTVDTAPLLSEPDSGVFASPWTPLHIPIINIPGFQGRDGLPLGLSMLAARGHDAHLLNICEQVHDIVAGKSSSVARSNT